MRSINLGHVGRIAAVVLGGSLLKMSLGHRRMLRPHTAKRRGAPKAGGHAEAVEVERSVTIGKTAEELYRLWRAPETLSRLLGGFAEVTPVEGDRMRWKVQGPFGQSVAWETRIVEDLPGERVRWESLPGAAWSLQGAVQFRAAPAQWGTEVTLRLHLHPPGGMPGEAAMRRLRAVPGGLVLKVLRRFKSLAETGEIPTLKNNPSARKSASAHGKRVC
ncbi:SRPBCC family protein [Stigmatella sp. ncwal1]|uniref:SRPBCC family protein n=1 Tax=Stigmatella ashevillensis TaxID=2995309 RepID=A0ABT5DB72_9BACT|nr:SRPBCC family protein [Stigmatella ashevillena]MDC0710894.1 SRPBCC family protein [Stigmatella ashevillena]